MVEKKFSALENNVDQVWYSTVRFLFLILHFTYIQDSREFKINLLKSKQCTYIRYLEFETESVFIG